MTEQPDLLVVDDEPDFAEFVRRVASGLGFRVRTANDGRQFRRLFAEKEPDAVVLDIVMPNEDGIELSRWLLEQHYAGGLLFISGYNPEYLRMAQLLAANDVAEPGVLTKPVKLAALREALTAMRDAREA